MALGSDIAAARHTFRIVEPLLALLRTVSRHDRHKGAVIVERHTSVEQQVAVVGLIHRAACKQEVDMVLQVLALEEFLLQTRHDCILFRCQTVRIRRVHGREAAFLHLVFDLVDFDRAFFVIDRMQMSHRVHFIMRMRLDQLALQLELDDGNGLTDFGKRLEVRGAHGVFARNKGLEAFAGIIRVLLDGKGQQRPQADAVADLKRVQVIVAGAETDHICNAGLIAAGSAHPENVVVAPLDVNAVIILQNIKHLVRARSPVKKIADDVQAENADLCDQVAHFDNEIVRNAGLDDRLDDFVLVFALGLRHGIAEEQLLDNIAEFLRNLLSDIRTCIFDSYDAQQRDQPVQRLDVKVSHVGLVLFDQLQLLLGIIDKGRQRAALFRAYIAAEGLVDLQFDNAGSISQNM